MKNEQDSKSPTIPPLPPATGSGHVEHTPAPWKAAKGHDGEPERWCVVADSEKQYLLAVIENGQPGDCCETEGATARLIAAAPELLEACRELVTAMVQLDKEHHREVWRARAAIQKASGQNVTFPDANTLDSQSFVDADDLGALRKKAKANGWGRVNGGDYCPACMEGM